MPHLRIEYSANLEPQINMAQFCRRLKQALVDTGLFELGAIRVRAYRAEHYAIADEMDANSFLDAVLRVGEGRSDKDLKAAGDAIFAMAEAELAHLFAAPHFALSFSIEQINSALSWKRNAIHPRLRGK